MGPSTAPEILRLEPEIETLYAKLRSGRVYPSKVKTGLVEESRKAEDVRHEYVFLVPEDYDSQKSYRVCFYLHRPFYIVNGEQDLVQAYSSCRPESVAGPCVPRLR